MSEMAHLLDIGYTDETAIQDNLMPLMEEIVHDTCDLFTRYDIYTAYEDGYSDGQYIGE